MDIVCFTFKGINYKIKRLDSGSIELIIDDDVQNNVIKIMESKYCRVKL